MADRIAFCITTLEVGGAERMLVELVTRLDRQRFDPLLICLGVPPTKTDGSLVERLAASQIPVHFLNARGNFDGVRTCLRVRNLLRELRPRLLQTWLWHANVLGPLAAPRETAVVTGLRVAEPTRRWRRIVERLAGRRAVAHVAVSEGVRRQAITEIGFAAEKCVVIPNGVALPDLTTLAQCSRVPTQIRRPYLLFAGRLERQKGLDSLVEMLPALLKRLPDHDVVLAGRGPLQNWARKRIADGRLEQRVHLIGWTADVTPLMARADCLLLPSLYEGMPNVVLEAMACGRPVVTTDVEGVNELLGDSPQVVPCGDHSAFIARVVDIAADGTLRESLGAENRRTAERLSLDRMVASYVLLYETLLRNR